MNHIKLQQDILKAKDAEDKRGKRSPFMYGLEENSVCICVNHCCVVVIPRVYWYLDNGKVFSTTPLKLDNMFKIKEDTVPVYDIGLIRMLPDGRKVREFKGDEFSVYLAEDNLKYFGKDVTEYQAINEKSPVYLYEYNRLAGIVYPVIF